MHLTAMACAHAHHAGLMKKNHVEASLKFAAHLFRYLFIRMCISGTIRDVYAFVDDNLMTQIMHTYLPTHTHTHTMIHKLIHKYWKIK